jgi:hypothetical protein
VLHQARRHPTDRLADRLAHWLPRYCETAIY